MSTDTIPPTTGSTNNHPGRAYSTRLVRDKRRFEVRELTIEQIVIGIRRGGFEQNGGDFAALCEQLLFRRAIGDAGAKQIDLAILEVGGKERVAKSKLKKGTALIHALSPVDVQIWTVRRALFKLAITEDELCAAISNPTAQSNLKERAYRTFLTLFPNVQVGPKDLIFDIYVVWTRAVLNSARTAYSRAKCSRASDDQTGSRDLLRVCVRIHGEPATISAAGASGVDEFAAVMHA